MAKNVDTKVITGTVRLSYSHIWEPYAMSAGQEKKYSCTLIIPKSDKATLGKIQKAIETAKQAGLAKLGGTIPKNMKYPLRDGDTDETKIDDRNYENSYFINTSCKTKPGIVNRMLQPIEDQDQVYSGCYVRASMNFYAFNSNGNRGIACGLNNIMKVKDGPYLGSRTSAESDFKDEVLEDDDDLYDLLG